MPICSLLTGTLNAAPPHCKTVERDGDVYEICERMDTACEALAKEQTKDPSKEWNGCFWPATIIKSNFVAAGLAGSWIHVTVVSSFLDSEKQDVSVIFEKPFCGLRTHKREDVPIVIRDGIPSASIDITCPDEPYGVPAVDTTEKGGKKEASHKYR